MLKKLRGLLPGRKMDIKVQGETRCLRFEQYEDRRMLAAMADIIFLVDESASDQNTHSHAWLATVIDDLATALSMATARSTTSISI